MNILGIKSHKINIHKTCLTHQRKYNLLYNNFKTYNTYRNSKHHTENALYRLQISLAQQKMVELWYQSPPAQRGTAELCPTILSMHNIEIELIIHLVSYMKILYRNITSLNNLKVSGLLLSPNRKKPIFMPVHFKGGEISQESY